MTGKRPRDVGPPAPDVTRAMALAHLALLARTQGPETGARYAVAGWLDELGQAVTVEREALLWAAVLRECPDLTSGANAAWCARARQHLTSPATPAPDGPPAQSTTGR